MGKHSAKTKVKSKTVALEGELIPAPRPKQQITPGIGGKFGHHRPKGTPNKITREVKDVIAKCFTDIGGAEAFARWARREQTEFYKIYAKLLPISLQANVTKTINVIVSPTDEQL